MIRLQKTLKISNISQTGLDSVCYDVIPALVGQLLVVDICNIHHRGRSHREVLKIIPIQIGIRKL